MNDKTINQVSIEALKAECRRLAELNAELLAACEKAVPLIHAAWATLDHDSEDALVGDLYDLQMNFALVITTGRTKS